MQPPLEQKEPIDNQDIIDADGQSNGKDSLARSLDDFTKTIEKYLDKDQLDKVLVAYEFAKSSHGGQKRLDGSPYISHPLAVAHILADLEFDHHSLISALLHDVIEDTSVTKDTINAKFGNQVADIVDGVSKLVTVFSSKDETQAQNIWKILTATTKDIRVILVKMADRLHNMRTLRFLAPEKQQRIARETYYIYVPIANRLGIRSILNELENLSFQILNPKEYKIAEEIYEKTYEQHQQKNQTIINTINKALEWDSIVAIITAQKKNIYELYKRINYNFNNINVANVLSYAIIVDSKKACYLTLGVLHNSFKPLSERFNDYIAIPKANGYQSLHTELLDEDGICIEVQIRTREMDRIARLGHIPTHVKSLKPNDQYKWLVDLGDMGKDEGNRLELVKNLKIDYSNEIFVYTPNGKVIHLPHEATALDFAYLIHSNVGDACVGCRINQQRKPLSSQLKNGQVVEIITHPSGRSIPKLEWLKFVVTYKARFSIKKALTNQTKAMLISHGIKLLTPHLERFNLSLDKVPSDRVDMILNKKQYPDTDHLMEQIGLGNCLPYEIAYLMTGIRHSIKKPNINIAKYIRGGIEALSLRRASCCNPVPADPIIGHLKTRDELIIHEETCSQTNNVRQRHPENILPLSWDEKNDRKNLVQLAIYTQNLNNNILTLSKLIPNNVDLLDIKIEQTAYDGDMATVYIVILVNNRDDLAFIIRRFRNLNGVKHIHKHMGK